MKRRLYAFVLFSLFCASCFDDDTNKDIRALNPIVIENIDLQDNYYSLYMGDTLRIEPLIYCEGVPDAKLKFEWLLSGGTLVPKVIDSTMYCAAKIVAPPNAVPYNLRLTVTDETTGIARLETFSIRVLSAYGEGLVVADTKDGQDSDLSLVMCKLFSDQISSNDNRIRIFRDIWSQNNGSRLPGLVLDAHTSSYGTNRSLTVVTTEHLFRADHYDYFNIPEEQDAGMFYVAPPYIGEEYTHACLAVYTSTSHELLSLNGYVTPRSVQNSNRKFDYVCYPPNANAYDVTMMYGPEYYPVYAYDALGERMLFFDFRKGWVPQEQGSGNKFDVGDLSDYEALFLGEISQGVCLLAREKATGRYKGLVMNKSGSNTPQYSRAIFDFTDATDIRNARFFELNTREDVVYYATESKLYATPTMSTHAQVQWEVPTALGEKITGIKIYDSWGGVRDHEMIDGSGKPSRMTWGSKDRLIMVFTYNESTREGKIYCLPIVTYGIGGLEQNKNYHVVLSGFGKILGVYKQEK